MEDTINIVDQAMKFATWKHQGQLDDAGKDYMVHPIQVASILAQVTDDDNLIAAALLHDTIEDTDTTYADLYITFGKDIADLVNEVSHEGSKDDKGYFFPRLETKRGIMLKFADRLSNISRMDAWPLKRQEQYLKKSKFWNTYPSIIMEAKITENTRKNVSSKYTKK